MDKIPKTAEEVAVMPLRDLVHYAVEGPAMRQSVTREELAMQRRSTRAAVYGFQNDESEDQRKEQLEKRNMAPKVRIVDGQIVVEKESIVYTTNTLAGPRQYETGPGRATSAWSYSGIKSSERWSEDETARFFQALSQCGTDFTLMSSFFPKRTRRQLHSKFKREEKLRPQMTEMVLSQQNALVLGQIEEAEPADATYEQAPREPAPAEE